MGVVGAVGGSEGGWGSVGDWVNGGFFCGRISAARELRELRRLGDTVEVKVEHTRRVGLPRLSTLLLRRCNLRNRQGGLVKNGGIKVHLSGGQRLVQGLQVTLEDSLSGGGAVRGSGWASLGLDAGRVQRMVSLSCPEVDCFVASSPIQADT